MGNRLCRRRGSTIDERFTKPQRLVRQPSNVDYKKLRKLIQSRKLAPCFDGVEDFNPDLEECPICFFYYPSLNRSRCCMKGICTECFLQMKPSSAVRPAQCPFCKSSSYAVEYHGAKTQEEKNLEQAEEQKVIEAKIRMRTRESENVDQIALDQISSNSELQSPTSFGGNSSGDSQETRESDGQIMGERIGVAQSPERPIEFNLDFEAIMMTEAILQSLQESSIRKNESYQSSAPSGSGGIQISTPKSNRSGSSSSPADPSEVILAESVTRQLALAIMQSDEQSEPTNDQRCKTEDQNCEEEYRDPLLEMQSATDSESTELNEAGSETGCLASSFATETDSWESLSARLLERNEDLEAGFTSDEDALGASDGGSSWLSSVHSISDRSCGGSPNCSDDEVGPSCRIVPSPSPAEQENP